MNDTFDWTAKQIIDVDERGNFYIDEGDKERLIQVERIASGGLRVGGTFVSHRALRAMSAPR